MTFASLQADVRNYLERGYSSTTDPIVFAQIPSLINLAERGIARALKVEGFIVAADAPLTTNVATYEKPDRWRETISINLRAPASGVRTPVFPRSYEYIRAYAPDGSVVGAPLFYADYDYNNWIFGPTPDAAYTMEIVYYEIPALLDNATTTNWLTKYAPDLLLFGTLMEAAPFLKNDTRIPVWESKYQRALQSLDTEDLKRIIDRSTKRSEP